jgi:hypothetical protein
LSNKEIVERTKVLVDEKVEQFMKAHIKYLNPMVAKFMKKRELGDPTA